MSDDTQEDKTWWSKLSQAFSSEPKNKLELVTLLRDAEQRDLIDSEALSMIEGVLYVSQMQACEIMLPRGNMTVIAKDATLPEIISIVTKSAHSRFPVVGDNKDEVIGILLAKDLLNYQMDPSERFNIRDVLRPVVFIPESKRLNVLLNEFKKNRNHIAMVVDEYGCVTGLVTIEDVLEQIVGDIEDEHDIDESEKIRQHTRSSYTVQALTPIGEFNEYFKTQLDEQDFDTIGGLVLQAFGHLPKRGESITINTMTFTIKRANSRRIKILNVSLEAKKAE